MSIFFSRRQFCKKSSLALFSLALLPYKNILANAEHSSHIPILMFHKVDDQPKYPEDISSSQLYELFSYCWQKNYYPVNISDIITNNLDNIVPKGLKPLGITADDSHRSILFSSKEVTHIEQRNSESFVEIFAASLQAYNVSPRATFFLSKIGDDRYSTESKGYFGNYIPLKDALKKVEHYKGLEFGYHTLTHKSMKNASPSEVKQAILEQMDSFKTEKVTDLISPLLAYPYGLAPTEDGIEALKELGIRAAVLAYPGNNEAKYSIIPPCEYSKQLITNPFTIPRISIGAYTYTPKSVQSSNPYTPINPIDDFRKDVELVWSF